LSVKSKAFDRIARRENPEHAEKINKARRRAIRGVEFLSELWLFSALSAVKGFCPVKSRTALPKTLWILAAAFALTAGITDLRYRKIPNWLTYSAIPIAIVLHWIVAGGHAALLSLAGAAIGLTVLLPFVLLGGLGGGDWKLMGALGAFLEPRRLLPVLLLTLMINGIMALALVLWKKGVGQTARNVGRITAAMFRFRAPGSDLSIDNSEAEKVPFGIAAAIATLLYVAAQPWVVF
jgi:prepilin peptidase CpaA